MINKKYKEIIEKSNKIYDQRVDKYKINSRSVLWDDSQRQYFRFYELVKNLDLNSTNKTIVDIGCGNGELFKFLNFIGYRGKYTGYDVNSKLISQAKMRFNKMDFVERDIMSIRQRRRFDYVLMSGLFNINVGQDMEYVYGFIKKMFNMCNEVTTFNAVSTHVNFKEDSLFYIDPSSLLDYCINNITPRITISHHNLPYNYTVSLYRSSNWISIHKK